MRGKRELKAMWTDPRMKELIESLWREYYGLYNEKYNRDPEKWLLNKIDKDIDYGQALGQDHLIEGNRSAAWGQGHVTKSFMEIVLGAYNLVPVGQDAEEWIPTDLLLTLGNGPDADNRSNVFEIYKNGFVKFLQSIKIGKHHDLEELETPENGTLQWTPEDGLEIWVDDHWEPVGGNDEMVCLMTPEFNKASPSGFLHSEFFTAITYPGGKTLIKPNISQIINVTNTYPETIIVQSGGTEYPLSQTANATTVRVFLNGIRQHPDDYSVIENTVVFDEPTYPGDKIRVFYEVWNADVSTSETPVGEIDGVNKEFTLEDTPDLTSLEVYLNGVLQNSDQITVAGKVITFTIAPYVGDIILIDYKTAAASGKAYNISPDGIINGANTDFTLPSEPAADTLKVYLNGVRQAPGIQYTLAGAIISFAVAPYTGDRIIIDYEH